MIIGGTDRCFSHSVETERGFMFKSVRGRLITTVLLMALAGWQLYDHYQTSCNNGEDAGCVATSIEGVRSLIESEAVTVRGLGSSAQALVAIVDGDGASGVRNRCCGDQAGQSAADHMDVGVGSLVAHTHTTTQPVPM